MGKLPPGKLYTVVNVWIDDAHPQTMTFKLETTEGDVRFVQVYGTFTDINPQLLEARDE